MKTLFRNLKILLLCIVAIALISLLSAAVIYLFVAGISNQWIWSSIILFVFIIVIWFLKWRVDWKHGGIIILVITAFLVRWLICGGTKYTMNLSDYFIEI
ncbi:MAG: hypothetical protein ABF991_12155 [Liquorilactobacillus hordei]|uniref:hypothetical protein n=1 Tax=Liquorilactobacillus hordei TaxID=468911 RepID=UPI0039E887C5